MRGPRNGARKPSGRLLLLPGRKKQPGPRLIRPLKQLHCMWVGGDVERTSAGPGCRMGAPASLGVGAPALLWPTLTATAAASRTRLATIAVASSPATRNSASSSSSGPALVAEASAG